MVESKSSTSRLPPGRSAGLATGRRRDRVIPGRGRTTSRRKHRSHPPAGSPAARASVAPLALLTPRQELGQCLHDQGGDRAARLPARCRTRATSVAGSRTVNTVVASGTAAGPSCAARSTYRRACLAEQPNRPASTRAASATATPAPSNSAAALTRRAYSPASARPRATGMPQNYYNSCHTGSNAPGPFQPAISQRDIELEVAQCVGGVLSPLLANIALTALDEHLMAPWKPGGAMSTQMRRRTRVRKNLPNWRLVRYADDFVVLVRGEPGHVQEVRDEITAVLAPLGLRLSQDKTRVVDMREGFDFLGFHIKWMRETRNGQVVRLHVHRGQTGPRVETEDPSPDPQADPRSTWAPC